MARVFFRFVFILSAPLLVSHEACHYLAARTMGADAEMHWHYVRVRGLQTNFQRILFKLAPSLVGIAVTVTAMVILVQVPFYGAVLMILALWFGFAWQISCYADFYDVVYFLRRGHWHPNENFVGSLSDAFAFNLRPRD